MCRLERAMLDPAHAANFLSCAKRPTSTPTIRLPVVVDLGWASRDVIKGTIAEPAYIMYGERLPCGSFLRRLES